MPRYGTVMRNTMILVVIAVMAIGADMFFFRAGTHVPADDGPSAPESQSVPDQ